jgi:uncharacterized protein YdeI (YjbR/CyaY-like superfamily)
MESLDGVDVMTFADTAQLETWMSDSCRLRTGVWLKIAKKSSGIASVTYAEALDVALCYGWIDGQRKSYDDVYYLQKITPRRPRSLWSQVNIGKVEALSAAGRMRERGLAEVMAAQADGRWDAAYESQRNATVPPDLAAALERNTQAKTFFEQLGKTAKYAVILRLMTARTPRTRTARLERMIAALEAGRTVQ